MCFAGEGSALAKTGDRILVESAVHDDGVEMCSVYVGEMYERYRKGEDIYRISGGNFWKKYVRFKFIAV